MHVIDRMIGWMDVIRNETYTTNHESKLFSAIIANVVDGGCESSNNNNNNTIFCSVKDRRTCCSEFELPVTIC